MARLQKFPHNTLESICEVLGDTGNGLTGTEIGKYLARCRIPDGITSTKRIRLYEALSAKQTKDDCGNCVIQLIHTVMDPVNHTRDPNWFEARRNELNTVLAFSGIAIGEDGKCRPVAAAKTLSDAAQKAERLRRKLRERGVHNDVLNFWYARLLEDNYFHAVLEASKSVADKIRQRTGLTEDGAALVDKAFGFRSQVPFLAFSQLQKETQQSEQTGLMNLMKGIFGTFRNPTAHEPEIHWPISEQDALDLLTMVSFLHRRIDAAHRTPRIV
jgi:uncharacterized protein (TIGR02391 family)